MPSSSRSSSASTGWCSPDAAIALARSVARRGLELGVLLKIYRAGQQAIFRYLTDLTAGLKQGDPSRDQVLVGVWSRADR